MSYRTSALWHRCPKTGITLHVSVIWKKSLSFEFLVAYTRLYTPLCPSVGRTHLTFFYVSYSVMSLLLRKWSSDLKYGPCPPARDFGSRVSSLVFLKLKTQCTGRRNFMGHYNFLRYFLHYFFITFFVKKIFFKWWTMNFCINLMYIMYWKRYRKKDFYKKIILCILTPGGKIISLYRNKEICIFKNMGFF